MTHEVCIECVRTSFFFAFDIHVYIIKREVVREFEDVSSKYQIEYFPSLCSFVRHVSGSAQSSS